jgi:hypothetical protein
VFAGTGRPFARSCLLERADWRFAAHRAGEKNLPGESSIQKEYAMIRTCLFAAIVMAAVPAHYAAAQTYKFKTIKDGKGMNTAMHDINDKNVAVGGVFPLGVTFRNCFVLTGKTITPLNDPNGVNGTECWGISKSGAIVGDYLDANNNDIGYIDVNGTFTDVKPPKSVFTLAYGVNSSNVVIGYYLDAKGNSYGFLFDGTKYTKITIKGGTSTEGFGINDAGDYTVTTVLSDGLTHSYLFSGGTQTEIIFPNFAQTAAHHINNNGQIVATVIDSSSNYFAGVYDTKKNKYYTLSDPKAANITIGDGINDKETIVGRYQDSGGDSYGYVAKGKL